jgi:serine/threonine protein kinase
MGLSGVIGDRFEIDRLAGEGGMGAVYRAWDRVGGVVVALKVLHHESEEHLARFARESRLLAHLDHPGIVDFVAEGTLSDGDAYLVMEWLEGESLSERLNRSLMTIGETLTVGAAVAAALGAAHARGVTHRDLKPGNIFLVDGAVDRVKVVDFGIARVADTARELTATEQMLGTPGYMSPEQMRASREVGPSSDVYALGSVIFKALTGRTPFVGASGLDVMLQAASGTAPLLSSLRSDVPPELVGLVAAMLASDRRARPADGRVAAQTLNALLTSRRQSGAQSWRAPAPLGIAALTQGPETAVTATPSASLDSTAHIAPQPDSYASYYGAVGQSHHTNTPLVASQVLAPSSPSTSAPGLKALWIGLAGLGALGLVALAAWIVLNGRPERTTELSRGSEPPRTSVPRAETPAPGSYACPGAICETLRYPHPKKMKVETLLSLAQTAVRRVEPKGQLTAIMVTNFKGGHVDMTDNQSTAYFEFSAAAPGQALGAHLTGTMLQAHYAPMTPGGPGAHPKCSSDTVWKATVALGLDPTHAVMLIYAPNLDFNHKLIDVWTITQPSTSSSASFNGQTCEQIPHSVRGLKPR